MGKAGAAPGDRSDRPGEDAAREDARLRSEIHRLRTQVQALEEDLLRSEDQRDTLEVFCFGLEEDYQRARRAVESSQKDLLARSLFRLQTLKRHQDDILANVSQGILTVNKDGTINAEYSRTAEQIFGRRDLAGLSFFVLFAHDPPLQERVRRYLAVQFENPWMDRKMHARLNPLAEYEYAVRDGGGEVKRRLLSFSFSRIKASGEADGSAADPAELGVPAPGIKIPPRVLVVIDDRTHEHELEAALRSQRMQIEKVHQILMLPPVVFAQFVTESRALVAGVGDRLRDLAAAEPARFRTGAVECMRMIHTIKGNARSLNLDAVAANAHAIEDHFAELVQEAEAQDWPALLDRTRAGVAALAEDLEDGRALFQRVLDVREALMGSGAPLRIAEVEATLSNIVRKEAPDAGKVVELIFEDRLSGTIAPPTLVRIKDALVQIVRNAIAHGLEREADRLRGGKPARGELRVCFREVGPDLVVSCRDDGQGLDVAALKAVAVARGLISAEAAERLERREAFRLAMLPEVSTARETSPLAGRGVGMDIVRESLAAIAGEIDIESEPSRFTEFVLRVPGSSIRRNASW